MSAISPTSGPWQVKHDWDLDGSTTVIGNVDGEIIDGTTHATFDFVCRTLDEDDDSQSRSVAAANARLIAGTPELVAALKAILNVRVEGWENIWAGSNRCQAIARAALAKVGEA